MFKNYLKIAARNLFKHKAHASINIAGLALGMASCILILLYVQDELSYDRFHHDADRLFRVAMTIDTRGVPTQFAPTMGPLAQALAGDYPEITDVAQVLPAGALLVSASPEKTDYEERGYMVDASFFKIFSFPLAYGDPTTAFAQPNAVLLTEEKAAKYFGKASAVGQRLEINGRPHIVSGVLKNLPHNSHFKPEFIAALSALREQRFMQNWHANMLHTYIKIAEGASVPALAAKISKVADRYVGETIRGNNQVYTFFLQPLTAIHLHSHLRYELEANGNITYVYVFAVVAALILLVACINFMNLATARSARRAKEVGLRKVIGAQRSQLIRQFLSEALLLSVLAAALAIALVEFVLPFFNQLAAKNLDFDPFNNGIIATGLVALTLVVGMLAGSYPAFVLSGFVPVQVLKGKLFAGGNWKSRAGAGQLLRKVLVVVQFTISIALIAGALVISDQLRFLRAQNLGFDKEQMLVLSARGKNELPEKYETIKNEFLRHPDILRVAASHSVPGRGVSNNLIGERENEDNRVQMNLLFIDHDFLETYGLDVIAGRNFSKDIPTEAGGKYALMNEAAVKAFGWSDPNRAVDKTFDGFTAPTVIGVVKDFHFKSLHENVGPLMLLLRPQSFQYLSLKIKPSNPTEVMAFVREKWSALLPGRPFEYFFLDEDYDKQYKAEERLGEIFSAFSFLAIVIAGLGLFGLVSFMAEQRTKEIGIRKVLGASIPGLVGLLSKDFVKFVFAAFVIATPVAYFAMNLWLQDFAYRIAIGWWVFALAGGMALLIALLTVSTQAIKAALANPVEALRYE
ncbi:MAG: ABC transporter permease [candidate division KSB1 bacterium]